jgi:hypothetical protein
MPTCKIIEDKMLGQDAEREIDYVSLPNSRIYGHIDDMPHGAEEHLCGKLKSNSFSIQVDDSTVFTLKGYVIAFVGFINVGEFQENSFCCKEMSETWKGRAIFNIAYSYQEKTSGSGKLCRLLY